MFYLELVTDMLHLLVYVIFFIIVFTNYGLPLHLVRLQFGYILCCLCASLSAGFVASGRPHRDKLRGCCASAAQQDTEQCACQRGGPDLLAHTHQGIVLHLRHHASSRRRCGTCTGRSATSATGSPISCGTGV